MFHVCALQLRLNIPQNMPLSPLAQVLHHLRPSMFFPLPTNAFQRNDCDVHGWVASESHSSLLNLSDAGASLCLHAKSKLILFQYICIILFLQLHRWDESVRDRWDTHDSRLMQIRTQCRRSQVVHPDTAASSQQMNAKSNEQIEYEKLYPAIQLFNTTKYVCKLTLSSSIRSMHSISHSITCACYVLLYNENSYAWLSVYK